MLQGMDPVGILILTAIALLPLGILTSFVAETKGWGARAWFFVGYFFPVVGLIAAAGLPMKPKG